MTNHVSTDIYKVLFEFHEKFERAVPHTLGLEDKLLQACKSVRGHACVLEIGSGRGFFAKRLLSDACGIHSYVGLEPSEGMRANLVPEIVSDARVTIVPERFEDWKTAGVYDLVVSEWVIHDIIGDARKSPSEIYKKIGALLAPGGTFLNLDVAWVGSEQLTLEGVQELIEATQNLTCTAAESVYQETWIQHLSNEVRYYLPLEQHVELLKDCGLKVEVLDTYKHSYILRAEKCE